MDEPPFALVCGWRYPLLIIAKGGSFSTVSMLRLYSSTSIACGFLYESICKSEFVSLLGIKKHVDTRKSRLPFQVNGLTFGGELGTRTPDPLRVMQVL